MMGNTASSRGFLGQVFRGGPERLGGLLLIKYRPSRSKRRCNSIKNNCLAALWRDWSRYSRRVSRIPVALAGAGFLTRRAFIGTNPRPIAASFRVAVTCSNRRRARRGLSTGGAHQLTRHQPPHYSFLMSSRWKSLLFALLLSGCWLQSGHAKDIPLIACASSAPNEALAAGTRQGIEQDPVSLIMPQSAGIMPQSAGDRLNPNRTSQ